MLAFLFIFGVIVFALPYWIEASTIIWP